MPFDANKLYASEILSILLQNHDGKLHCLFFVVLILYVLDFYIHHLYNRHIFF